MTASRPELSREKIDIMNVHTEPYSESSSRDIRHLSANKLSANLVIVPQETMLFSGTIYESDSGQSSCNA